jgi:hypothetical protein
MRVEIDIWDHLSEEDVKQCAMNAMVGVFKENISTEKELQRIISNNAYHAVWQKVDEVLDEDIEGLIAKKVKKIVKTKLSEFTIFKKPDAWDREPNSAYKYLMECVEEQKPKIKAAVEEQIEAQTLKALEEDIGEFIIRAVQDLYRGCGGDTE